MFAPLPRHDPDYEIAFEPPLATSGWLDAGTVRAALGVDIAIPSTDILLGQLSSPTDQSSQCIGYGDDRHLVTIAGSRSGKGTSLIIPNLLHYAGSVVVIDPKGENANLTAKYRAETLGQHVIVLDPFHVADVDDLYQGTFNPLTTLNALDPEIVDEAASLADAIVIRSKSSKDPHWDDTARMLIKATILFVLEYEFPENQTFTRVKELLTVGLAHPAADEGAVNDVTIPPSLDDYIEALKHSDQFNGALAAAGHALRDMGDQERGSVLSTTRRHLEFVSSLPMQDQIAMSSFDPNELKTSLHGTTIYLVLPEYRLSGHSRWLRLMITTLLNALQRGTNTAGGANNNVAQNETLFILDEFATSIGYLEAIERAASYIAGFGVKLWSILQDLNQLKDLYNRRWETFIGNAGVLTAFANTDTATLDYLSKRLGEVEITKTESSLTETGGKSRSRAGLGKWMGTLTSEKATIESALGDETAGSSSGYSRQVSPRKSTAPLLRADEVARYFARKSESERDSEMLLCLIAGVQPVRLQKLFYYRHDILKSRLMTTD